MRHLFSLTITILFTQLIHSQNLVHNDMLKSKNLGIVWSAGLGYGVHQFGDVSIDRANFLGNISSVSTPVTSSVALVFMLKKKHI